MARTAGPGWREAAAMRIMSAMEAATVPAKAPRGGIWGASPALLRLSSDPQLVALVRAGRAAAFEAVYDRHHRPILAFCGHLLGDRDEAEDALQHVFLSAYNGIVASSQPIQLRPWLFAIARNRCYSMLRARREVAVAELADGVSEEPAVLVQRREELRDLVLDLGRLPHDQRAALVMAELGALSHEEIALALEVPRDKVKALVFQARESLLATRTARETDCDEIRRQLRTTRGPSLRRGMLRRHLHDCPGCREYRRQLRHQRGRLAVVLPFAPTLALKEAVLRATGGGPSIASASGSAGAGTVVKLGLLKPVVGAVAAVVGAASAVVVVHTVVHHGHSPAPQIAAHRLSPSAPRGHGQRTPRGPASASGTGRARSAVAVAGATREFVVRRRLAGRVTSTAKREVRFWAHRQYLDLLTRRRAAARRRYASSTRPPSVPATPSTTSGSRTGTLVAQAPTSLSGPKATSVSATKPFAQATTARATGHPDDPGAARGANDPVRLDGRGRDRREPTTAPLLASPLAPVGATHTTATRTTPRRIAVAPTKPARATPPLAARVPLVAAVPAPAPTPVAAPARYRPRTTRTRRTALWPQHPGH